MRRQYNIRRKHRPSRNRSWHGMVVGVSLLTGFMVTSLCAKLSGPLAGRHSTQNLEQAVLRIADAFDYYNDLRFSAAN